ncbi:MAG: hypothetical protein DI617_02360 [Streptococcus pyogenes]|uniref:hypothetical protein n=1 Tax=Streptococcus halichoeri TaxID=254785 RepID=UPI000DB2EAA3|nr:hypothetical protein [Streptococcus halichoeri]PZO95913.1 MAG: hypothetical protein DI617_02360 [Streptococcus pyogenes]
MKVKLALVLSLLVMVPTSIFAGTRQVGQLFHFRILPAFAATPYLEKMNDSYYVVNLNSRSPQIRVKHYLANTNGARRSDVDLTWTGQRGIYTNNAKPHYLYNLNLARENFWDTAAYIDGSWSLDSH